MRIIGIDPGTICCGYGIVEIGGREPLYVTCGDIRMSSKKPLPERLKILYDSLKAIIAEHKPSQLCMEKIFYHESIRSAFALGSTRGIAMLLAAEYSLPLFEYNPTEVKMALTGYGRAEKRQVRDMVIRMLKLDRSSNISEDSSDALALIICHINSSNKLKLK
jgi:crossover junction endodeoxyribonuclease RuvC